MNNTVVIKKLFDKRNQGCYDSVYVFARSNKWLSSDRFGISFAKGIAQSWYSISRDKVIHMSHGELIDRIKFAEYFMFERRTLDDF